MNTQTWKAKGRRFQQYIRDRLREELNTWFQVPPEDIQSTSMGAPGEDVTMPEYVRAFFPFSVECKAHKAFTIYNHFKQAEENSGKYSPVLFIKGDRKKPLAVIEADVFFKLLYPPAEEF